MACVIESITVHKVGDEYHIFRGGEFLKRAGLGVAAQLEKAKKEGIPVHTVVPGKKSKKRKSTKTTSEGPSKPPKAGDPGSKKEGQGRVEFRDTHPASFALGEDVSREVGDAAVPAECCPPEKRLKALHKADKPSTSRAPSMAVEKLFGNKINVPAPEAKGVTAVQKATGVELGEANRVADTLANVWCAACDNGGDLVLCEGPCGRSFHLPRNQDGRSCNPLCVPPELAGGILKSTEPFYCPHCLFSRQQCFSCKIVGYSVGKDAVIFKCLFSGCNRFYCKTCIRKMGCTENDLECPCHTCSKCGLGHIQGANNPLITCRMCPTSFHYLCMPQEVITSNPKRLWCEEGNFQRCAYDRTGGRASSNGGITQFFCTRHESDPETGVFFHEHPLFSKILLNRWREHYRSLLNVSDFSNVQIQQGSGQLLISQTAMDEPTPMSRTTLQEGAESNVIQDKKLTLDKSSISQIPNSLSGSQISKVIVQKGDVDCSSLLRPPAEATTSIAAVMNRANAGCTMRSARDSIAVTPPYNKEYRQNWSDDLIEDYCQQLHTGTASNQLREKAISMSNSMRTALTPLLCDVVRYTSYGRHFTNTGILMEIVTRVIPHMAQGDLVVDCSCGANEWLEIMRNTCEMEDLKITCRGYDLFTPFYMQDWVRRSWLETSAEDLCDGDQLVVGLNPPFGVNAALAQLFVEHAAKFEPRVIVLIAPAIMPLPAGYTIVEEDFELCSDKSFYIPGLRQKSWNKDPPPFRILQRNRKPAKTLFSWDHKLLQDQET